MPEFVGPTLPRLSPIRFARIEVRAKSTDPWFLLTHAKLDFAIWACAPTVSRAQFSLKYGYGQLYDEPLQRIIFPRDLNRWMVRIEIPTEEQHRVLYYDPSQPAPTDEDFEVAYRDLLVWNGFVEITSDVQDSTTDINTNLKVAGGERTFMAYGWEGMLDRHRIVESKFRRPDHVDSLISTSLTGITFNAMGRGNRSKEMEKLSPPFPGGTTGLDDYHVFQYHANDKDANENVWSTRDIVRYLCRSGVGLPRQSFVAGATDEEKEDGRRLFKFNIDRKSLEFLPEWDAPEIECHLESMWDLLNTLISRRRLLTWWLEFDKWNDEICWLRVRSMTDVELELPGDTGEADQPSVIVPNDDTDQLRFDEHFSADVVLQIDSSHSVDQVVCYGARRTNTATMDFGMSTSDQFRPGWTPAEQVLYELGASTHPNVPPVEEVAERQQWHAWRRSREDVNHVFMRYQLNHLLRFPPDDSEYWQFFGDVRLLPSIPLKEATDYSGYKIETRTVDLTKERELLETRPPLVMIEVPNLAGRYVDVARMGRGGNIEAVENDDVRDWAAIVRVPKDGNTLTVNTTRGPQHLLAFPDFHPQPEDEMVHGEWDWKTMRATVSFADDRFCEVAYPPNEELGDIEFARTMRIPCGAQYRLDWVRQDTVIDLDAEGYPITVATSAYIKDDTDRLHKIARSAYEWYSRTRSAIRVTFPWDAPAHLLHLGMYITHLDQSDTRHEVQAAITQLEIHAVHHEGELPPRHALPPMRMVLHTAFGELDFLRLHAHGAKRARRERETKR